MKQYRQIWCFVMAGLLGLGTSQAFASSLIRDAEVEHTLRLMSTPIFKSADIPPETVKIFILNDSSINAFVAGGLNLFVHTGLILNTETPGMLMGVIAHETGHIAGAHLSQLSSASEQASMSAILSAVAGAAAILGGNGQAGGAILSAGQNTALRQLLSYYRGNEQQADQAGIKFLEANQISPWGMLQMFEVLRRNEQQHVGSPDPYLRTHPLTSERIATLRSAVDNSALPHEKIPDGVMRWYIRMVAKLYAFLEQPEKALERYKAPLATDKSAEAEAAHLARAVALFRKLDLPGALKEVDALIAIAPDAFGYDLKGQLLFESGQVDGAIAAYARANQLLPDNALLLTDLGRSYLAKEDKTLLPKAVAALEKAAQLDDANSATFRNLAMAYGQEGNIGESNLALARESALINEPEKTIEYAKRARRALPVASPSRLKAEDILHEARRLLKEQNEDRLSPF